MGVESFLITDRCGLWQASEVGSYLPNGMVCLYALCGYTSVLMLRLFLHAINKI